MPPPSVVLVGRPNVGKSTLFNRISETRRAIVAPIPGTTRDVIAHPAEWQGTRFRLVDTGGMFGASQDPLHELVLARGRRAVAEADLLVLVVDGREGLVPGDLQIAQVVRAANVPALLAINKTDDKRARGVMEFYELGFDQVYEVSAEHASGVGDLLDGIVEALPRQTPARQGPDDDSDTDAALASGDSSAVASGTSMPGDSGDVSPVASGTSTPVASDTSTPVASGNVSPVASGFSRKKYPEDNQIEPDEIAVAIVGRPNAGKSSLVNRLLREERMIVSEMPGTTRDAVDAVLTWHRRQFRIVDTAGIRRPGRVAASGQIESVSVLLARRAIEAADVVVLVVDANAGATDQDATIAGEADKAGRGVIIAANKWDLMKDRGPDFVKGFDETLRRQLKFLDYAPVLHISAATGERTPKVLEWIDRVAASRRKRVKTPELNRFVQTVTAQHPPASPGRKHVRIMYAAQTAVAPPTFVFFTNVATTFHFSYERFLVNELRTAFGFIGSPIRLHVRRRSDTAKPNPARTGSSSKRDAERKAKPPAGKRAAASSSAKRAKPRGMTRSKRSKRGGS